MKGETGALEKCYEVYNSPYNPESFRQECLIAYKIDFYKQIF